MDFSARRNEARAYLDRFYRTVLMRPPPRTRRREASRLDEAERWAVAVEVADGDAVQELTLEVRIPSDFPLHPPSVYLGEADHSRLFPIPHVDHRRFVCTFDIAETIPNVDAPGAIVAATVEKAVGILEDGLAKRNVGDFDDEVLAYWSQEYRGCGPADTGWLSLIEGDLGDEAVVLTPQRPVGPFSHVIHSGGELADRLRRNLKADGNRFTEDQAFVLGTVSLGRPPYGLRNESAVEIIEAADRLEPFRRYLGGAPDPATVLFQTVAGGHILGWRHARSPKPNRKSRKGYNAGRLSPLGALRGPDRTTPVRRLNPEVYTPARLRRRTAGEGERQRAQPRVFAAGLGSIGARLVDDVSGIASGFGLLDPDILSVENVGRHLLGLDAVGYNKAEALATRLRLANPLVEVEAVSDRRLAQALSGDPALFDAYDRLLIAIGDLPTELWLDAEMDAGRVETPALYLWVEPYLAGGHCVYVRPGEARLASLFEGDRYAHDVISASEHESRQFTRREAGCQTTFVPYADVYVRQFLAAIFPHVLDALQSDVPSFRLRWTGDIDLVRQVGVSVEEDCDESFRLDFDLL